MKNWKVPAIILVLLIVAMAFRWDVDTSTGNGGSTGAIVSKFRSDRWNGAIYHETMTNSYYNKYTIKRQKFPYDWNSSDYLTKIWGVATVGCVVWLLYGLNISKKKEGLNVG